MYCPACGHAAREGAAFCPNCGNQLPQFPPPTGAGAAWSDDGQPKINYGDSIDSAPVNSASVEPEGQPLPQFVGATSGPPLRAPWSPESTVSRPGVRRRGWFVAAAVLAVVAVGLIGAIVLWPTGTHPGDKADSSANGLGPPSSTSAISSPDPSPSTASASSSSSVVTSSPTTPSSAPKPAYIPSLPRSGEAVPRAELPQLPSAGSLAVPYTDATGTPTTAGQLVEWRYTGLPAQQSAAIDAIVTFMLRINAGDHRAAWEASTGRYDFALHAYAAFDHGYRTSRFYQVAFGTPSTLAPDLIAVPLRFVSRQNGVAQGNPDIPSCAYWPQFVYLVAYRGGAWLPDIVAAYDRRPETARFKRTGSHGRPALDPLQQRTPC